MDNEELKAKQARLGVHAYWYYGTNCRKCHDVWPTIKVEYHIGWDECYFMCEVCGRRTKNCITLQEAEQEWNGGHTSIEGIQLGIEL